MGKIFLPVTGHKHDKRSIEIASLIAQERSDVVHIFHVVPSEEAAIPGEKLLKHIEAKVETYGVECEKELAVGEDVDGRIIGKLKSGAFYLGVLSIRSSESREKGAMSPRMERIIKEIREIPLVIVQEVDVV